MTWMERIFKARVRKHLHTEPERREQLPGEERIFQKLTIEHVNRSEAAGSQAPAKGAAPKKLSPRPQQSKR